MASGFIGKSPELLGFGFGKGGNGKSLIEDFIYKTLGNYHLAIKCSYFMTQDLDSKNANCTEKDLHNIRMASFSETPHNALFLSQKVKTLTGNSSIRARGLFESDSNIKLCCTVNGSGQTRIQLDESSDAVERRIIPFHFPNRFLCKKKIEQMKENGEDVSNCFLRNDNYKLPKFMNGMRQTIFNVMKKYCERLACEGFSILAT